MAQKSTLFNKQVNPLVQIALMILSTLCIVYGFYFSANYFYSLDLEPEIKNTVTRRDAKSVFVRIQVQDFLKTDLNKGIATIELIISFKHQYPAFNEVVFTSLFFKHSLIREKQHMTHFKEGEDTVDVWRLVIDGSFDFDYSLFPLNDHLLTISLCTTHPEIEFVVNPESLTLFFERDLSGWEILKKRVLSPARRIHLSLWRKKATFLK